MPERAFDNSAGCGHNKSVRTIYLDYNATTPLDASVREAMLPFLGEVWGNPSSVHHVGRRARALLDEARDRVAQVWACKPSEVIFTSGGTEANNLAIFGAARLLRDKGRHLITTRIEHHAVLHCFEYLAKKEGFEVTWLPVNQEGIVEVESLAQALRPDTVLVSVMAANNETGALQPVAEVGRICRERGVLFHSDAVQCFGKERFENVHQFNADLVSCCAHKFHGPKGAGALFIRSPLHPDPILFGGGHENERRAGTENLPGIIGLAEAMERFVKTPVFCSEALAPLADRLVRSVDQLAPRVVVLRSPRRPELRLANTTAFTVRGVDSMTLLAGLDLEGVCASSGSACSAGSLEPSHVMVALGAAKDEASGLVRLSLGRETTAEEVAVVESVLPEVIARALK
jgi:cysteine desulfurase